MDKIVTQRASVKRFWESQRDQVANISSVKEVYGIYCEYAKNEDAIMQVKEYPPINEYIFRTLIRKMGYSNSVQKQE
jgi:hypothetical protein